MKAYFISLISTFIIIGISCEKEPSMVTLTEIDMSRENSDLNYVYYRFINETGVPICIEYVEPYSDLGMSGELTNHTDMVARIVCDQKGFKSVDESFAAIVVFYNRLYSMDYKGNMVVYKAPDEGSPMNPASWSEEVVDRNSVIRTFTFTKEHYNAIK